jgi:S-formylglutathione hydrolase FrmB
MRRGLILIVALLALAAAPSARADGLQLVSTAQLDSRLVELTFHTPALSADTHVRVLLPQGYDASGRTRYPVLYLLHGAVDDYRSWTDKGDAERITAAYPLIVVMPDAGQYGNYTDWYNDGAFGPPEWERYHIGQLLPWIDAHYSTRGTRGGRAVAGLSMGGNGTMAYAARHPDLFAAAASFSGAVDTNNLGVEPVTQASGLSDGSHTPGAIFGLRPTEEVRWRGHNPWDLAENLAGIALWVRTGNGSPGGPYAGTPDTFDPVEYDVHDQSTSFHNRLLALGIPHLWDDYGPGTHAWPYWQRDLRETLPEVMQAFGHPPAPPSPFSFTAIEPRYAAYGWNVVLARPALEFSELRNAGPGGFDLAGSGSATVTTAGLYAPGSLVRAVLTSGSGTVVRALPADGAGRVTISVPLGPGNPYQQYSPQAAALGGTAVYTTHVALSGTRRG